MGLPPRWAWGLIESASAAPISLRTIGLLSIMSAPFLDGLCYTALCAPHELASNQIVLTLRAVVACSQDNEENTHTKSDCPLLTSEQTSVGGSLAPGPTSQARPAVHRVETMSEPAASSGDRSAVQAVALEQFSVVDDPPPWSLVRLAQSVSLRDREAMRSVCKSWRAIVSSDALWESFSLTAEMVNHPLAELHLTSTLRIHGQHIRELDLSLSGAPAARFRLADPQGGLSWRAGSGCLPAILAGCPNLRLVDIAGFCAPPPGIGALRDLLAPQPRASPGAVRAAFRLRTDVLVEDGELLKRPQASSLSPAGPASSDGLDGTLRCLTDPRLDIRFAKFQFWEARTRLIVRCTRCAVLRRVFSEAVPLFIVQPQSQRTHMLF